MGWQYHPVLLLFHLGGLVAVGVAVYCWRSVRRHGASYLVVATGLLGVADAVWAFAAALKTASVGLAPKLLFYKLQFVGSWTAPSLVLIIALAYVGRDRWLGAGTVGVLSAVPLVGVALLALNPGQAMITDPVVVEAWGVLALEHSFPPLFLLFLSWALGVTLLAAAVIVGGVVTDRVPARPAMYVVVVLLLPVASVLLKAAGIYPPGGTGVNVTPGVNGVALALLAYVVVSYRLFELLPVGRHHAIEVMDDGYLLVGPDGTTVDANPGAVELLDAPSTDAIIGEPVESVLPSSAGLDGGDGTGRTVTTEDRVIELRRSAISRQNQDAGHLLLLGDVTEQRRRQQELEQTNQRLERFASVVSHDLRNPLNVAQGELDVEREANDSEHLARVDDSLARMETLIDEVLTLARTGEPVSEPGTVSLSAVVERCWRGVATAEATVTVSEDCEFRADRTRLQQLLENLFRNAVEHGGTNVSVRVGPLPDDDGFYVADDGPGIPEDERRQVFEYGHSTSPDGNGLGLAIVREIAAAHDWQVTVTDADGGGARFEVSGADVVD